MSKVQFLASIKERYRLNHPNSSKATYHVVLDIRGSKTQYNVGDCVAIYPTNHSDQVEKILSHLKVNGEEIIFPPDTSPISFSSYLLTKANLLRVNSSLAAHATYKPCASQLKSYLENYEVADFLTDHQIFCTPQELVLHLSPVTPRFYSIASSMNTVGEEIHLTIALTEYEMRGQMRYGTCSYYLTHTAPLNKAIIPIYFQPTRDFTLPKGIEDKDIIMIGPGAGVAPFLGFMQERIYAHHSGRNWLFFGERHRSHDFYYASFWEKHQLNNKLKLDLAFSRDQSEKIYVQHKMLEHSKELMRWLDAGAYLYVCGNASKMAKDVEKALQQIIISEKDFSDEKARDYIKKIRREKRYLRDIY